MPPSYLRRLDFWLNNKIPLIGGMFRLGAAQDLARDSSFEALEILALAYEHWDKKVRAFVHAHLDNIDASQKAVDAICRAWLVNRSSALGNLMELRGWVAASPPRLTVYSALRANRPDLLRGLGSQMVHPLLDAAAGTDSLLARRALRCFETLSSQGAVNALWEIWGQSRQNPRPEHPLLETLVLSSGYIATKPPKLRVLSALKAGKPFALADEPPPAVPFLVDALNDPDPEIARHAVQAMTALQHPGARDAICRFFLDAEYPGLEQAIVQGGYLPTRQADRALFLFLTTQWDRYEALDFDHNLLRTIYEAANPVLRERIMRALRQAGRVTYLTIFTGRDEAERIQQMSPADYDLLVNLLVTNQEWLRLWVLAQKLPPAWGVRIVQSLAKAAWTPPDPSDQALLAELIDLAGPSGRSGLLPVFQSLSRQAPPAVERARLRLHHGKLNAVAFDPCSPVLALVSSRRRVVLWNYHSGEIDRVIRTTAQGEQFAHSLGEVCYTKRGELVFAERTNGNEYCHIYAEINREVRRIFTETGSITALAPVGETGVLAAGRSMFVTRMDMDHPSQAAARRVFNNWARGLAVSANGETAALLQQGVTVVDTADLERKAWGYGGGQVVSCAAFSPDNHTLIAGRLNGAVHLFRLGNNLGTDKRAFPNHRGSLQGIIAFQKYPLILTAGAEGLLRFITWPERKRYGEIGRDGDTISGLSLSNDESALAVIHGEDQISLWDLRPLEIPTLLSQPLSALSPIQFSNLKRLSTLTGMSEAHQRALTFAVRLLHHRFRYDVEIESTTEIAPGEFDIELDDLATA